MAYQETKFGYVDPEDAANQAELRNKLDEARNKTQHEEAQKKGDNLSNLGVSGLKVGDAILAAASSYLTNGLIDTLPFIGTGDNLLANLAPTKSKILSSITPALGVLGGDQALTPDQILKYGIKSAAGKKIADITQKAAEEELPKNFEVDTLEYNPETGGFKKKYGKKDPTKLIEIEEKVKSGQRDEAKLKEEIRHNKEMERNARTRIGDAREKASKDNDYAKAAAIATSTLNSDLEYLNEKDPTAKTMRLLDTIDSIYAALKSRSGTAGKEVALGPSVKVTDGKTTKVIATKDYLANKDKLRIVK